MKEIHSTVEEVNKNKADFETNVKQFVGKLDLNGNLHDVMMQVLKEETLDLSSGSETAELLKQVFVEQHQSIELFVNLDQLVSYQKCL